MWILNICVFASTSENGALILYFRKYNFESFKKLQSIVNIFVFFIEIRYQSKESNLHFSPTPPFPEKIFPRPYCQIKVGGEGKNYENTIFIG